MGACCWHLPHFSVNCSIFFAMVSQKYQCFLILIASDRPLEWLPHDPPCVRFRTVNASIVDMLNKARLYLIYTIFPPLQEKKNYSDEN